MDVKTTILELILKRLSKSFNNVVLFDGKSPTKTELADGTAAEFGQTTIQIVQESEDLTRQNAVWISELKMKAIAFLHRNSEGDVPAIVASKAQYAILKAIASDLGWDKNAKTTTLDSVDVEFETSGNACAILEIGFTIVYDLTFTF
jgi:hypothetical protein